MSCTGTTNCTCGCCAGTSVQTPLAAKQSAGPLLDPIAPAPGPVSRNPCWRGCRAPIIRRWALKTRDDDDFTIALLDATAVVLDILTFYQERLANESYLRTAHQLRSLTELSRLIGYQPSPGVSASVYLAFTLKAARGKAPDPASRPASFRKERRCKAFPRTGRSRRRSKPRPTFTPRRIGMRCRCKPACPGWRRTVPVSISPEPRPSCSPATLYYSWRRARDMDA